MPTTSAFFALESCASGEASRMTIGAQWGSCHRKCRDSWPERSHWNTVSQSRARAYASTTLLTANQTLNKSWAGHQSYCYLCRQSKRDARHQHAAKLAYIGPYHGKLGLQPIRSWFSEHQLGQPLEYDSPFHSLAPRKCCHRASDRRAIQAN